MCGSPADRSLLSACRGMTGRAGTCAWRFGPGRRGRRLPCWLFQDSDIFCCRCIGRIDFQDLLQVADRHSFVFFNVIIISGKIKVGVQDLRSVFYRVRSVGCLGGRIQAAAGDPRRRSRPKRASKKVGRVIPNVPLRIFAHSETAG